MSPRIVCECHDYVMASKGTISVQPAVQLYRVRTCMHVCLFGVHSYVLFVLVSIVSIVSIVVGKARASIVCSSQTRFHIDLLGINSRLASVDQFGA